MAETYIQHNPNVPSGRKAFVELFSKQRPPRPVEPRIKMKVISSPDISRCQRRFDQKVAVVVPADDQSNVEGNLK
jgi:hypothetical protein